MKEKNNIDPQLVEEEYEEIDVMELLRKLVREWKQILTWCAVAAVVGLVIAFSIPREYTVVSKLAPESTTRGGSGGLGSLASLAGISLGSVSSEDAVYPDLYPDIISSTPFVVELFPVQVNFLHKKELMSADFYTYLNDYNREAWWSALLSLPYKALGRVRRLGSGKEAPVEGYANLNPQELTQEQEDVAKVIRKSISLAVDKKTSVLSLSVTAQDPQVAAKISEEVILRLQTYVTHYRTGKSRQDLEYYEGLYEEAKAAYIEAQQRYASFVDHNQGIILQRVKAEQERLQNEMSLNFQLYNACAQQLQSAKAKVQQETPVFTVIEPPQVPLKRSKPSKVTILIACMFLGAAAASVKILFKG